MKEFTELKQLLDYIVETAKEDYHDEFYNPIECIKGKHISYEMAPLCVKYNNKETEFFGGIVPFSRMAISFEYQGIHFRACESLESGYTRISFAPKKETLFDQCWCIEIPVEIHNFIYESNKIN